ncbi:MAG: hypothetical protein GXY74_10760 [Phycisphaerae bacterium]|nr:hypothetical protein [Phycisphaerae bacterium]
MNSETASRTADAGTLLRGITVEAIAQACETSPDELWRLARNSKLLFKLPRQQRKKGGGFRVIYPPTKTHKPLLKRMARFLSRQIPVHSAAHGGVKGRSSFTSAAKHLGATVLVVRDIEECYPSIGPQALANALKRLGASPSLAKFLSSIMTVDGQIPQGGPLSSLALNLFFYRQDEHLHRKARRVRGAYTRLADDLVASVGDTETGAAMGREFDSAISSRHLRVNASKRAKKGLLGGDKLKEIHSLIVNSRRGLRPKDEHVQKALRFLQNYCRRCRSATPADLESLAYLRRVVCGWMYYMRQAARSPARHMRKQIHLADARVTQMLKKHAIQAKKNKWWVLSSKRNEPRRLAAQWVWREVNAARAG